MNLYYRILFRKKLVSSVRLTYICGLHTKRKIIIKKYKGIVMKKALLTLIMVCSTLPFICAQATVNLVQSLSTLEAGMQVDLPGEVVFEEWDQNMVRLEIQVAAATRDVVLSSLTKVGRYKVETIEKNGTVVLVMPKASRKVVIRGEELKETYRIVVKHPSSTILEQMQVTSAVEEI